MYKMQFKAIKINKYINKQKTHLTIIKLQLKNLISYILQKNHYFLFVIFKLISLFLYETLNVK